VDYGRAAAFGTGDVQIARVVSKLRATGYRGPLLLEVDTRESGLDAVRNAADYLRTMLA
jgi:sugar phosphate isomerase/epimerase